MRKKIFFTVLAVWGLLLAHEKWILHKLNTDGGFTGMMLNDYILNSRPTFYEQIGFGMYSGSAKLPANLTRMEREIR